MIPGTGRPRCLVCGAAHASCGPKTTTIPVDARTKERDRMAGPLKLYPNPARAGAFLRLSDTDAKRLGVFGQDEGEVRKTAPTADLTNAGGEGIIRSSTGDPVAEVIVVEPAPGTPDPQAAGEPATSSEEPSPTPESTETPSSPAPTAPSAPEGALPPAGPTHRARAAAEAEAAARGDVDPEGEEDDDDEELPDAAKKAAPSSRRRRAPKE